MKKILFLAALMTATLFTACNKCGCGQECAQKCGENCDQKCEKKCERQCCNAQGNVGDIVYNAIVTRKSVRAYTDQPVDSLIIDKILRAGMSAPTAVNSQPWALGVITDRELLQVLSDTLHQRNPQMVSGCAFAIVVAGDMTKAFEGEGWSFWVEDCSAMTENMLLAAHGFGLGACWIGGYPNREKAQKIADVLNISDRYLVLDVLTMGYPAEDPDVKDKWNPEAIHYNRW
ncbi:MAG: nitroreductase family protein [Paludibacteraceae bacterium]|nr:nitroreductase family protein [Paludibacteraceae bacterium]